MWTSWVFKILQRLVLKAAYKVIYWLLSPRDKLLSSKVISLRLLTAFRTLNSSSTSSRCRMRRTRKWNFWWNVSRRRLSRRSIQMIKLWLRIKIGLTKKFYSPHTIRPMLYQPNQKKGRWYPVMYSRSLKLWAMRTSQLLYCLTVPSGMRKSSKHRAICPFQPVWTWTSANTNHWPQAQRNQLTLL